ncbi:unnamed protein product [Orchesella dallaii]|uniref:G-protein coupled receptors family 1 profile domain-containing protein n=1 Tax=Orchesella dallaii TaxID=48710 RepID=A0ABP1R6D9_9HEXA
MNDSNQFFSGIPSTENSFLEIESWYEFPEKNASDTTTTSAIMFRDCIRFWTHYILVPIVVIIGVMGNAVTIFILTRRPMRSATNVYLTALAVSDLVYLLFSFSMSWRHFPHVNKIWPYWWYTPFGLWVTDASSSTSVWITVSFTIERYIAVCQPTRGKNCGGENRALFTAVAVYIACFAFTATTPFEWRPVVTFSADKNMTFNETIYTLERTPFGNDETYRMVYHWFTTIFFVLLPMLILGVLNFFLIQAVRKCQAVRRNSCSDAPFTVRQLQRIEQENRITKILIGVVITFLICQMPTALVLIYTSWVPIPFPDSDEEAILLGLGNIFNLLVAINAASNFILYTALSDKYRKYFCRIFYFCKRKRSSASAATLANMNHRQFAPPLRLHLRNDSFYEGEE